jgi:urocanate hydratase
MNRLAALALLIALSVPADADPISDVLAYSYVLCGAQPMDEVPLGTEEGCSLGYAVATGKLYRNDFRPVVPRNICREYLDDATAADIDRCVAGYEIGVELALRERGRP